MTRAEAQLQLAATTLRPQDASAEARAMAERDPALGAWLEQRTEFDESVAAAFAASIPAGLRESILNHARKPAKRPLRWILPPLIAAAAAVALGWTLWWPVTSDMPAWQSESLAVVAKLQLGMTGLDDRADNLEAVKKLLAATHSPSPHHLPGSIDTKPTYGCKRIEVAGRPATIICFRLDGGDEAHLVVMDNSDLGSEPPKEVPEFINSNKWHMARWSDGQQSYLLATTASEAELKKLLGLV